MEKSYSILSQSSWWILNKKLVKILGVHSALILSDFISKYEYFNDRGESDKDGGFFNTRESLEQDTGLSPFLLKQAISNLIEKQLISIKKYGIPAKTFYYINFTKIDELIRKEIL